nr:acyltransferase family protein [Staphylococcus massiliensis]
MLILRLNRLHKARYMPGLDGLRAIAVLGIIIYHLNKQWLTGGFLGVDTFFVISGYLITSLLLNEYNKNGTIDLKRFWIKRIKRLFPAVFFMIGVVLVYTLFFEPDSIVNFKNDAIASIFYVTNWWFIFDNVSYFDQFEMKPFMHLWSLAIEEQFYIFFPIVLLFLLKKVKKLNKIFTILFILSLVSLVLMIIIFSITDNSSRVYFGTDTRLQTLLLGVLLSFIWPPFNLRQHPPKRVVMFIDILGFISLALLILCFFFITDKTGWIYNGGFYLISLMTLFLIAACAHPASKLAKLMGNKVFVYIGKRSYSLYLWHFPVITLLHNHFVKGQYPWYVYLLDILIMLALTEFSYNFIEKPIRKGGFKSFSINPVKVKRFVRTALTALVLVPSILILCGAFNHLGKDTAKKEKKQEFTSNQGNAEPKPPSKEGSGNESEEESNYLLMGDSVMVDIGERVKQDHPNAVIDGKVGRQLRDVIPLANNKYQKFNTENSKIILELGTNGAFTKQEMDQLTQAFDKAQIYVVTTRVPREYEAQVNTALHQVADEKENVKLIDWYKASEGHQEYFAHDGIHLEKPGIDRLAQLINEETEEKP